MTFENLISAIQATGLIAARVRTAGEDEKTFRTFFEGNLDQYLETAKAIGSKVVFVEPTEFEDWLFTYNPADESEEEDEELHEDIDLAALSPSLAKFKKHLNQHYHFLLSAKGGGVDLDYVLEQEWVEKFEAELDAAQEKADIQIAMKKINKDKGLRN